MEFEWINIRDKMVTQELLDSFESGNSVFDVFLKEKAGYWQDHSEAATFVFVSKDDLNVGQIERIYGYVSINAMGLLYQNVDGDNQYSEMLFTMVLQNLYQMSTHNIGFRAIYLNSNDEGYKLYRKCGFEEVPSHYCYL